MSSRNSAPTAAVLLIGNELLSGRTQDINLAYIAKCMVAKGIRLQEARMIQDVPEVIISSVNELRDRHTYVFTTGGIGPTHDDITADCVAHAFGVELPIHPEAKARLLAHFKAINVESNEDRMRMARIPEGATLVDNDVSAAPGFRLDNVFVFAGVPRIMQSMLDSVLPDLESGPVLHSVTVICNLGEGAVATPLRKLQENYPSVDLGSYPGKVADGFRLSLVARSTDESELDQVKTALQQLIVDQGGKLLGEQA